MRTEIENELIQRVVKARQYMEEATDQYKEALTDALDHRITIAKLARELNISDNALYVYKRRHGL